MRICMIAKYPPTQGGVAVRAWRIAHGLARRGHEVEVITGAGEVAAPYRIFMRPADWARLDGAYGEGRVTVHWTEPFGAAQFHIPIASPVVGKLAGIALARHRDKPFDLVFSVYLEPNAIAGHLVAEALGLPHVVKTDGSDVGRLWNHAQLAPLYDIVLRRAALVFAAGAVADRLRALGTPRVAPDREFAIPDHDFLASSERLDLDGLLAELAADPDFRPRPTGRVAPDAPLIGVYGKLGPNKGTAELLHVAARLVAAGRDFGLVLMGQSRAVGGFDIGGLMGDPALAGRVLQIPFLPPWRVPAFVRRCAAVAFLEQGFPIVEHGPVAPREGLLAGGAVVLSAELAAKLPFADRVIDGFNCLVVPDVTDVTALQDRITAILDDPDAAREMARRGRAYALGVQQGIDYGASIERALRSVVAGSTEPPEPTKPNEPPEPLEPLGPARRRGSRAIRHLAVGPLSAAAFAAA
ncbi:MAG: glycosyltransferase family 4 protein, partial [Alphaproteobacteria bacterium]|nr:glycosyltransferase family 4 protein [Alphaproteobacteria bacterium]